MTREGLATTAECPENSVCCLYADGGLTGIQAQLDDLRLGSGQSARQVETARPRDRRVSFREVAKPGIAPGSGPGDRGFESRLPDHSPRDQRTKRQYILRQEGRRSGSKDRGGATVRRSSPPRRESTSTASISPRKLLYAAFVREQLPRDAKRAAS